MKKLLIGGLMSLVILTGCGGGKETATLCKGNIDQYTKTSMEISAKGDKVNKMTTSVVYDLSALLSDSVTMDDYKSTIDALYKDYQSIKGLDYSIKAEGKTFVVNIGIDLSKTSIKDLQKTGLVDASGKVDYISLKETVKQQEGGGLTCTEK